MGTRDPRVDAYIATAPAFAQPILTHVRDVMHEGCPGVVETMKWNSPFFDYNGGPLAMMAAFKEHCRVGFWKGALVIGDEPFGAAEEDPSARSASPQGGPRRFSSVKDLPPKKTLLAYVKKAAALNAEGVKVAKPPRAKKPEAVAPDDLAAALAKKAHANARAQWDAFSPSHRREYIEWITEAKGDATRARRLEQTLAQLAEGKPRHWKYQRA